MGVCLVLLVGMALGRELAGQNQATRPQAPRQVLATPRPALTAEEEAYAQGLWPIHNDVKASALRVSMASIQFRTNALDLAGLRRTVEGAVATYQRAESEMQALRPPPTFQAHHDDYLRAVGLYRQAAAEIMKVGGDSPEDHLANAFPSGQEGGRILRRVGSVLWPSEYVPS